MRKLHDADLFIANLLMLPAVALLALFMSNLLPVWFDQFPNINPFLLLLLKIIIVLGSVFLEAFIIELLSTSFLFKEVTFTKSLFLATLSKAVISLLIVIVYLVKGDEVLYSMRTALIYYSFVLNIFVVGIASIKMYDIPFIEGMKVGAVTAVFQILGSIIAFFVFNLSLVL